MAQLYSLGKNHGIQPFIVQIRDEETHKPMPGITLGDIGTKVGFGTVNNGFMAFNQVRIPYENMLMKNAKLTLEGEYIKPKSEKLNYGTMVFIRVQIISTSAACISLASTIATRYSMVRRQSPINPNEPEPKIIEHVTQQYKLFPSIAKAVVFKCMAKWLLNFYGSITQRGNADLERLPELHAISSGLKAVCSDEAAKTVEICRLSCGGHGYLYSAGLVEIYRNATSAQTYEGENTVMLLQTSRFLIKVFTQAMKGEKVQSGFDYIQQFIARRGRREVFDDSVEGILRAMQAATAGRIQSAWKSIEEKKKTLSVEQATNQSGIELIKSSRLYCNAFLLKIAIQELGQTIRNVSPALGEVFKNILELYAVDLILSSLNDVLQFVDISNSDIEKLQKRLEDSLKFFRTAAIGIVDGFDFSDQVLRSTLGAYDGNVYERLFEAAKKSPLNQEDVNKSFDLYLKPFMKSNL